MHGRCITRFTHVCRKLSEPPHAAAAGAEAAGAAAACNRSIAEHEQADQELRQHRGHLEGLVARAAARLEDQSQLIDQLHDSVITTNRQGCVTSWNRGAERQFGYTAHQALGNHVSFLYAEEEQARLHQAIDGLSGRGVIEHDARLRCHDAHHFHGRVSWMLRRDKNGRSAGMIAHVIDVTERRETARELHYGSVDLSDLARGSAVRLREAQPEREVEFRIQQDLRARGDEKLLRIAVDNLLGNAWKYTRSRDKAVIEFGTLELAGEHTCCDGNGHP